MYRQAALLQIGLVMPCLTVKRAIFAGDGGGGGGAAAAAEGCICGQFQIETTEA